LEIYNTVCNLKLRTVGQQWILTDIDKEHRNDNIFVEKITYIEMVVCVTGKTHYFVSTVVNEKKTIY